MTYNLHILLRFEIEQADLQRRDQDEGHSQGLERKVQELFRALTPRNDAEGCLQDIHWAAGLFGYFATYSLGNLYSAQFFAKAKQDIG